MWVEFRPAVRELFLIAYRSRHPVYEVEFVDGAGESLGTFTVKERDPEEIEESDSQ